MVSSRPLGVLAGAEPSADGSKAGSNKVAADSSLEERGFELVWGFCCQVIVCGWSVLCSERRAVLRPVAYDQVRGARGRGQGTETVAKQLGGLPLSGACVSQRL